MTIGVLLLTACGLMPSAALPLPLAPPPPASVQLPPGSCSFPVLLANDEVSVALTLGAIHGPPPRGDQVMEKWPTAVHEIVLGTGVAHKLEARPGDEVVGLWQGADGAVGNGLFTVSDVVFLPGDLGQQVAVANIDPDDAGCLPEDGLELRAIVASDVPAALAVGEVAQGLAQSSRASVVAWRSTLSKQSMAEMTNHLVEGELPARRQAVLGAGLARSLHLNIGDKVVFTATGPAGEIEATLYRIAGRLQTGDRATDDHALLVLAE
jgi:hypothetical protein